MWIDGTNGVNLEAYQDVPDCYPEPGPLMLLYSNGVGKPAWGHNVHAQNKKFNLPIGHQDDSGFSDIFQQKDIDCAINRPLGNGEKCPNTDFPRQMAQVMVMRYLIAPDPVDGVPSLWRSANGGFSDTDVAVSNDPLSAAPDAGWRLIARGVEDLQVQYRNGNSPINAWNDNPGVVDPTATDFNTIVREVRVTLGARTAQTNLAGARTSAQGGDAVRGQLVSTITPRAAMFYLGQQDLWH